MSAHDRPISLLLRPLRHFIRYMVVGALFLLVSSVTNHHKNALLPRAPLTTSEEDSEKTAMLLFTAIEKRIEQIDILAYILIITTTLLAILFTFLFKGEAASNTVTTSSFISQFLSFSMLLCLLLSCYCGMRTVLPRLHDRDRITLLHYEHIAALTREKFIANFQQLPLREFKESFLVEIHVKSCIASNKQISFYWGLRLLFASLVLWLSLQVMLVL